MYYKRVVKILGYAIIREAKERKYKTAMNEIINWAKSLSGFALTKVLPAVFVLMIGVLVIRIIMKIIKKTLERAHTEKAVSSLIVSVARIVLYLLLGLIVASGLGIDVTGVVALASVLTLAISLALQDALTNLIGGFTLLYTKPFVSGDFVEIAGQSGSVKEVGLTYTKLITGDNKVVSIPNSAVTAAEIVNYTVTGTRRLDVKVSVSYKAPMDDVLEALLAAAEGLPKLEDQEVVATIHSYTDQAVVYMLRFWCTADDYWPNTFEANKRIKKNFDAKGIKMTCLNVNLEMEK